MAWIILLLFMILWELLMHNEVKEEIEAILRLSRRGKPELVEKRKEELKSMVSEEQYINIISKINSQLAEDKY